MIDKEAIRASVEKAIEGTPLFVVDITVGADNNIVVELDSPTGVDLDKCVEINRAIEADFDRDDEDYSLEVGSAGLTAPFKVAGQYLKNIDNEIEVLTRDGKKLRGTLVSYTDTPEPEFVLSVSRKVKEPGAKRPVVRAEEMTIPVAQTKDVRYLIDFK